MAAARSGAGAVTVLLLKAAKMTLDASKLLFWPVQRVYGGEMGAMRGYNGAVMG